MLPAKKLNYETFEKRNDNGQSYPPEPRHGQFGPNPPKTLPTKSDQHDQLLSLPGQIDETNLDETINQVRTHQQNDLAMLRLAFRKFIEVKNQTENFDEAEQKTNLSPSEINQLVSAVVRIHGDEREILGITPIEKNEDKYHEFQHLENLSSRELLELCYKEGITPPSTSQTQTQEEDSYRTGET